jgi:type VI secretion system protein ImpA
LKDMQKAMSPYVSQPAAELAGEAGTATGDGSAASGGAGSPRQAISGEIQSRDDVIKMLEKICEYYQRTEPSSPVPSLLRRGQRLAVMNFMDVIKELCPDAESAVRTITGERVES